MWYAFKEFEKTNNIGFKHKQMSCNLHNILCENLKLCANIKKRKYIYNEIPDNKKGRRGRKRRQERAGEGEESQEEKGEKGKGRRRGEKKMVVGIIKLIDFKLGNFLFTREMN